MRKARAHLGRPPYHQTPSGLYRSAVRHPFTGARVLLSSFDLGELMDRRRRWEALRREMLYSSTCPNCGCELLASLSKDEADKKIAALISRNPHAPERRVMTLASAWRAYEDSSPREHRQKLRAVYAHHIAPFFTQGISLPELGEARMRVWFEALAKAEYAPATVRNAFWLVAACYRRAVKRHMAPKIEPWGDLKPPKVTSPEPRVLTRDELRAIAERLSGWRKRLVLFAVLTGLRNGELAALGWDDIDLEAGTMRVRHKSIDEWRRYYPHKSRPDFVVKSKRPHTQKLHPQARAQLEEQQLAMAAAGTYHAQGPVWPNKAGEWRNNATAIRPDWLKAAAEAAGVDPRRIYAHTLRHTFVSWEIRAGSDLLSAQQRVGHHSVRTTADVYAHHLGLAESKIPPLQGLMGILRAPP